MHTITANATNAQTIDELFDGDMDMTDFIVEEATRFPSQDETTRKITISMPKWMIGELDAIARRHAVTRQAVINLWIGERLAEEKKAALK